MVTEMSRHIDASPEAVYRALIDPIAVQQWKVPSGMTSIVHEFEARVGGRYRVSLTYELDTGTGKTSSQTDTYHGYFKELVPNRKVVEVTEFETVDPDLQGAMTITVTLDDDGEGGTRLHAVHEGLPPGVDPADNETGWSSSLDKLAALVA